MNYDGLKSLVEHRMTGKHADFVNRALDRYDQFMTKSLVLDSDELPELSRVLNTHKDFVKFSSAYENVLNKANLPILNSTQVYKGFFINAMHNVDINSKRENDLGTYVALDHQSKKTINSFFDKNQKAFKDLENGQSEKVAKLFDKYLQSQNKGETMTEKKESDPVKSFKYHQENVLEKLDKLEKQLQSAKKDLDFEPVEKGWDQARAMRKVNNELAKFTLTLSEIGQKDYFVSRKDYKAELSKSFEDLKKDISFDKLDEKTQEVFSDQEKVMHNTHPGNFRRVREIAVSMIAKQDKDIANKFAEIIEMPKVKAVAVSKDLEKSQEQGRGR